MLFNSFEFLIFFPVVAVLHFLLPFRARWLFLLVASYFFYMWWRPAYILLIVASTLIDYLAGRMMGRTDDLRKTPEIPDSEPADQPRAALFLQILQLLQRFPPGRLHRARPALCRSRDG